MRALQDPLADLGFLRRSGVDGQAGEQTRFAVVAFQKWARLDRDGVAGPRTRDALARAKRPTPRTKGSGRRVEVLLDRQLALYISGKRVVRALHVSTGAPGFATPTGRYSVFRKERNSWSVPYRVWLPWASYFVGGVAFHESPDVPAGPASHGCVRVPRYDAQWLYDRLPNGTAVTVVADLMRARLAIAAVLAVLAAPAAAPAQTPTKTPGQLVVGVSMPAAGFQVGAVRGREVLFAKGYEIDLAKALAGELAVPAVRFVQEDRFTAFFQPGPKEYDLALSQITITGARDAVVDFSAPYFTADQGVLLRRGLTLEKRTFEQLRKLRLCAERATSGGTQAKRIRPDRPVRLFRDASRLEAELYQRRCDAVIGDSARLGALRAQAPQRFGALAGRIRTGERYGIVLDTGSALKAPLDAALGRLEEDGTLGRLAARWFSTDVTRLRAFR